MKIIKNTVFRLALVGGAIIITKKCKRGCFVWLFRRSSSDMS